MRADFDLAIVGSGFAGSLLAMIARRLGRSVVLLERDRHPRFAIGESSTPLANLLLEELARRYDLPAILSLTKWGTWQKTHPEIPCGLKRGFTFYHHTLDAPWTRTINRVNELLVAASPHDGIADTHWYRAGFDHFLVRKAMEAGAELVDQVALHQAELSDDSVQLTGKRAGREVSVRARFVVDASGPRGFLHRALRLRESEFPGFPATQVLYTHFTGVRRWDELRSMDESPPYPVDDAALHHVFDGGWIWVLRFNNGITSAGVAATEKFAQELNLAEGAAAWSRLMERLPSVHEQFELSRPVLPFMHAPRLAFRTEVVAGPRWALLPSAAGFVDPLLSTGFPLTLLGVQRLAKLLEGEWQSLDFADGLARYSNQTLSELDVAADLVSALYANMGDSERFNALTLLYFAAASFSESARRLGRADLAGSFMLHDDAVFGPKLARCLQVARSICGNSASGSSRGNEAQTSSGIPSISGEQSLLTSAATILSQRLGSSSGAGHGRELPALVRDAIEPINVAGLGDAARRNWYPALAADLREAAPKLHADRQEIDRLLATSGFNAA